ncbi:hypothetical protein NPIL_418371 [Nephila pilipes]|uniref:Uncharacterized protein n=1 Tax=Nephila pilipes TaxID=299642 RepID=A0A8X6MLV2_NEPPI|nr:hypothetical protein NPIL_418371 [Nephila pilipes]
MAYIVRFTVQQLFENVFPSPRLYAKFKRTDRWKTTKKLLQPLLLWSYRMVQTGRRRSFADRSDPIYVAFSTSLGWLSEQTELSLLGQREKLSLFEAPPKKISCGVQYPRRCIIIFIEMAKLYG